MEPDLLHVSGQEVPPDRYKTFDGIDCDGKARRVMECIERNMTGPGSEHRFLKYFMAKRAPKSGPIPDDLFLLHSNLNQIREFLEGCNDQPWTCSCNWMRPVADGAELAAASPGRGPASVAP